MKASQFLISTLKEAPADAEVTSAKLMLRAGMIKKLGAGIYNYMPMGLRVIRKVEAIVREEMNRAGAVEVSMPIIQPAELWQETGRFDKMGPELLRLKDRHGRDFVAQPTSEEVVTDIARQEFRSYKQLPKNLYQIQTKFRDERRPRFGVMRGREFTMKDAYSFDRNPEAAKYSYQIMADAYRRIFDRFGLTYRAVAADSGAIGGDLSEEFQVIAATGEDAIVYCPTSSYAANIEKAEALAPSQPRPAASRAMEKTPTPGKSTCADVAALLNVPLATTVKSLVLATDELNEQGEVVKSQVWLLLLRGDHDMNEVKVGKLPGLKDGFRFASLAEIEDHFGCKPGYLGPAGLLKPLKIVADREVAVMADFICGANAVDFHMTGVNWTRDLPEPDLVADLRNVVEGDASPDGQGVLAIERGIEVGHIFYLGTKYSKAMNATFLDENGKPQFMEMGCYGIGITRLPAAAIEQNHDDKGIIWPDALAPFTVVVCPIGADRSPKVKTASEQIYAELLAAGADVMLDDRGERPGAMFADWELIGVPHRITVGDRALKEGQVEYQHRRDAAASRVAVGDVAATVLASPSLMNAPLTRRQAALCGALQLTGVGLLGVPTAAQAGKQLEEPLIDSVRSALSAAIANTAPPVPEFKDTESRLVYLRWLGEMSTRLQKKKSDFKTRKEFLQSLWYEAKRAGLDVSLVLGLVQVESNFRKFAVSPVGARGYMQVMPFWARLIGDGDAAKLFHMQTNLRFGCVILRHYLDRERGDEFMALGRYNGSRGKREYPDAVFASQKNWVMPVQTDLSAPTPRPAASSASPK